MSGLIALPPLTPWNLLWALGALAGTGLVALLVAAAGAYVYYKVRYGVIDRFPGPKAVPLLGTVMEHGLSTNYAQFIMNVCDNVATEGVYRTWLGIFPNVEVMEPDLVQEVIASSRNNEKAGLYDLLVPWLGDGLLIAGGKKWHGRRRLITPAFHFDILKTFALTMNERANITLQLLQKPAQTGEVIDISSMMTRLTLDVICETAMGKHLDAQIKGENLPYVQAVYRASATLLHRIQHPWLLANAIFHLSPTGRQWRKDLRTMHDFVGEVIRERRRALTGPDGKIHVDSKRPAFLDLILSATDEDGKPLSDRAILEETNTFMFAGHDTTATALSWALFVLGQEPHVQAKLQKEIDNYMDAAGTSDMTSEDLAELEYLDRFVKEVMRLHPSVPFIARTLTEDVTMRGVTVPKGAMCTIQIYPLHHNKKFWSDSFKFDPDRWLPENSEGRHPFAYIPFSAGPRNCMGQKFAQLEEKIVLAKLIRHYHFTTVDPNVKGLPDLVYRPATPVLVTLRQRRPIPQV